MDILDILLDILLKPPQPFIGQFYVGQGVIQSDKCMWKPFNSIIVGLNGCISVNTLWTLINYNLMEGHSQQVN